MREPRKLNKLPRLLKRLGSILGKRKQIRLHLGLWVSILCIQGLKMRLASGSYRGKDMGCLQNLVGGHR